MSKAQVTIDQKPERGKERFRASEFKRIVALTWQFKRVLITGLVCTVVYACLHTGSIGAAFPIFKILLEEEGLKGWVNRTVAERRIGVETAPPGDGSQLLLLKVSSDSALYAAPLFKSLALSLAMAAVIFILKFAFPLGGMVGLLLFTAAGAAVYLAFLWKFDFHFIKANVLMDKAA